MTNIQAESSSRKLGDWRLTLAVALFIVAALPIKIFSVPGFEVTPALLLSPLGLMLLKKDDKVSWAVIFFMFFCGALALIGATGSEGVSRNLLGAASYSSGAPFILVGVVLAGYYSGFDRLTKLLIPSVALMLTVLLIDAYRTGGNLVILSSYVSESYSSPDTSFINSTFPFYGKFAVITLATIAMFVGCLGMASVNSFDNIYLKYVVLIGCTVLVFISYSLWG